MPTRNGVINISLYVKKENSYTKYCADKNGNLICSKSGTKDDIITDGITDEFDAVYDSDSFLHFSKIKFQALTRRPFGANLSPSKGTGLPGTGRSSAP